jgi:hypothetical protein
MRGLIALIAIAVATTAMPSTAAKPPDSWEGLVKVPSKRLDLVYLAPGADFRGYTKVMLDPPEAAFRKDWQRDTNSSTRGLSRMVSNKQAHAILEHAQSGFADRLTKAWQEAGYQVVSAPGPDVLRLRTGIVNLDVAAPDTMSPGRSVSFSREAGGATVVLEARDSETGALLGRAVDSRSTGDTGPYLRNSVTNAAAFDDLFTRWAKASANGLGELKRLSPIDVNGQLRR